MCEGHDDLRSARVRRESYVGPWLPEPLLTDGFVPDGARIVEDADSVSMAFLLVLERLTPVERWPCAPAATCARSGAGREP